MTGLSNDTFLVMKEQYLYLYNSSIWSDVMGELRTGIKLKKVSFSKTPSEFGLTPYEMLMSDIRKQSVKLNPTKIPPKVKTDAKDIILEFIRSRPPLRKASNRKLAPRVIKTTPMEDLMEVFGISVSWRLPCWFWPNGWGTKNESRNVKIWLQWRGRTVIIHISSSSAF